MEEEVLTPQPKYVPYATEAEAQAKVDAINQNYATAWEDRSTVNYDVPKERDGQWYICIVSGFEGEFSEEELARGVETLPEITLTEEL